MKFELSSKGRSMAKEFFSVRPYIGPLPVRITDYVESVKSQKVNNKTISIDHMPLFLQSNKDKYSKWFDNLQD